MREKFYYFLKVQFFSRAHKTMPSTRDQLSVKEPNNMPSVMFLAQYTLGKLCEMRSNYTPSPYL